MPNEIIAAATRPIFRWIRNFAHGLHFLALAAAFAFPFLNPNAASLHDAARDGNLGEVRFLITVPGADINVKDKQQRTPLHFAVALGYGDKNYGKITQIVNILLGAGAHVNAKDNRGWTPLHYVTSHPFPSQEKVAERIERTSTLLALLTAGADVNAMDNEGRTPMDINADWGLFLKDLADLIVSDHEIDDVNAKDRNGKTLLHYAVLRNRNLDKVNRLIASSADVNAKDNAGWTPLHLAARYERTAYIHALIVAGADVNARNNIGWTPLHLAGWHSTAEALLAAGADVNAKDNAGWTPLHLAGGDHSYRQDLILLASGADVNAKSNTGWTPLHMAVSYTDMEFTRTLVDAGADVNVKNNNGETPLDIVIQSNANWGSKRHEIITVLSEANSPAGPGEPTKEQVVGTSGLTIERIGERTEVRWKDDVLQFSPLADGQWRDVILDQGFFRLRPQD